MGKKTIRTTKADGTVETTVVTTHGAGHALFVVIAACFVAAELIHTWWLGLAVIGLVIVGLIGKKVDKQNARRSS